MTILLITSAELLLINSKFNFSLELSDLNRNKIKENPVITKKSISINIPLDESFANEWTLVNIPDLTRNVPKILSEKQSIDRKTIHLFKISSLKC